MYTIRISDKPRASYPATNSLDLAELIITGDIDNKTGDSRVALWIRNEVNHGRTVITMDWDQARRIGKAMLKLADYPNK